MVATLCGFYIGARKVFSFEQEWLIVRFGKRISKTVTEIQSCRMVSLAETPPGAPGSPRSTARTADVSMIIRASSSANRHVSLFLIFRLIALSLQGRILMRILPCAITLSSCHANAFSKATAYFQTCRKTRSVIAPKAAIQSKNDSLQQRENGNSAVHAVC